MFGRGKDRTTQYEGLTPGTTINGHTVQPAPDKIEEEAERFDIEDVLDAMPERDQINYLKQLTPDELKGMAIQDILKGVECEDWEEGTYYQARAAALGNLAVLRMLEQLPTNTSIPHF